MILCWMLISYWKDCKEIGKENLAVPLKDRFKAYFFCFVLPVVMGLLMRN